MSIYGNPVMLGGSGGGGETNILIGTSVPSAGQGNNGQIYFNYTNIGSAPSGYTRLTYIEASGTQYIDTGVPARQNLKIEIDYQCVFSSLTYFDQTVIGGSGAADSCIYWGYNWLSNQMSYYANFLGDWIDLTNLTDYDRHFMSISAGSDGIYLTRDGENIYSSATPATSMTYTNNLIIFNRPNGSNPAYGKLYSLKIYDKANNNALIRNFIPVKRNSDSVIGLYDLANNQFYGNSGSGVFTGITAGEIISTYAKVSDTWQNLIGTNIKDIRLGNGQEYTSKIPAAYQRVEYLESSGTQYIDTGVIPTSNTEVIIKGRIMALHPDSNNNDILCGERSQAGGHGMRFLPFSTSGGDTKTVRCAYGDGQISELLTYEEEHYIDFNNASSQVILDGNNMGTLTGTYTQAPNALYLFAAGDDNSTPSFYSIGRIYYCKIIEKPGNVLRELIPCYRKADNVAGMYDIISGIFYTNKGTGSFAVGMNYSEDGTKDFINWNDNLLCNWDFTNPVNTRGNSSYSTSGAIYTLDGWYLQAGVLNLVAGGIKLSRYTSGTNAFFMQRFPSAITNAYATYNTPMICTAIIDGTIASFDPQLTSGQGGKGGTWINGVGVRFWNYGSMVAFTIDINEDTGDHLIQAVKLETGTVQTLATLTNGGFTFNNIMDAQTEKIRIASGWAMNTV